MKGKLYKVDDELVLFGYTGPRRGFSITDDDLKIWTWTGWHHEENPSNKQTLIGATCLARW
jgi:hypothetical protein